MRRTKAYFYLFYAITLGLVLILLHKTVFRNTKYELGHFNAKSFLAEDYSRFGQNVTEPNPKIRLLCFVLANPLKEDERMLAVKNTWGKRCDKLIFMSNKEDSDLGAVNLNVTDGRNHLWEKVFLSLKYIYDHHINEYDWFLKADDDTFVIVENLRYVLTPYDPEFPISLGGRSVVLEKDFLSGGCGYVLSRAALKRFIEVAYHNPKLCNPTSGTSGEDIQLGRCMRNSGIMLGDTRDELGKRRFFQLILDAYVSGSCVKSHTWLKYGVVKGIDSMSETAVSFHYLKAVSQLYAFEYLIYKLKLFGTSHREFNGPFPAPLPPDVNSIPEQVLEKFGHPDLDKRNTVPENLHHEEEPELV